jgi:hypothetical protein
MRRRRALSYGSAARENEMQRAIKVLLAAAAFGGVLVTQPAAAVPVSCLGADCVVSDNGVEFIVDSDGEARELRIGLLQQLFQQALSITLGVNSPANPVVASELHEAYPITSATADEDTNQIVVVFSDGTLSITVTYTLVGTELTGMVSYFAVIQNLTDSPIDLALVDYIDFDLRGTEFFDTIEFLPPNVMQTTGKGVVATARSVSAFDYQDVGECCETALYDRLVDGHLGGAVGPVGPSDVSGAFQNNIALTSSGAFTVSRELNVITPPINRIAPAPSLSPAGFAAALLALAAVGFAAMRRIPG